MSFVLCGCPQSAGALFPACAMTLVRNGTKFMPALIVTSYPHSRISSGRASDTRPHIQCGMSLPHSPQLTAAKFLVWRLLCRFHAFECLLTGANLNALRFSFRALA